MPTVSFYTLGCKLNQYETEAMRQQLEAADYRVVDFGHRSDVAIINTCTVTHRSDQRCRQMVRRAVRQRSGRVVVTGCYAQRDAEALSRISGVDLILGNLEKGRILEYLTTGPNRHIVVSPITSQQSFQEMEVADFTHHTRAFIKIQDGCDGHCTYCVVPLVRGRSRSRPLDRIMTQADAFIRSGYHELVLTGVNLGRYEDPQHPPWNLAYLLRQLQSHRQLGRLRLSSIEPTDFGSDLIELLRNSKKICRHVHIPMQSGDDDILQAMGRPYTAAVFAELIENLAEAVPGIAIGVDVIVGFPGETDRQFETTRGLLEQLPICRFHVFSFSQRPGTPAATLSPQVPAEVCRLRSQELRSLSRRKFRNFLSSFQKRRLTVLTEKRRDAQTGLLTGLSDNYIRVLMEGPDRYMNRLLPLEIRHLEEDRVWGRMVSEERV
jgi:threonylcarbamoyladenosine tRNA methylthiotransferase MtaB